MFFACPGIPAPLDKCPVHFINLQKSRLVLVCPGMWVLDRSSTLCLAGKKTKYTKTKHQRTKYQQQQHTECFFLLWILYDIILQIRPTKAAIKTTCHTENNQKHFNMSSPTQHLLFLPLLSILLVTARQPGRE